MTANASRDWRQTLRQRTNLLVVIAALAVGLTGYLGYLTGDNLYVNEIPPWDAHTYTSLARDLPVGVTRVGPYHIQRIFPSAIVYFVFRTFRITPTDANIINAFIVLDAFMITLMGFLFCLIADLLGISNRGKWLGFVGLFINFAVLKHRLYDPILTDTTAYALGMLILYFYLRRSLVGVIVASILGAFTWPTMLIQGALMIVFFERRAEDGPVSPKPAYLKWAAIAVAVLLSLGACWPILHAKSISFNTGMQGYPPAFYFSLAIVVAYAFFGVKTLLSSGDLLNFRYLLTYLVSWRTVLRIVLAVGLFVLIKGLQEYVASKHAFDYPTFRYIMVTFWVSILYPAVFFISHVVYFGPVIILLLFLWPQVCTLIQKHGMGLGLSALFCFVLSLNSESRGMINFIPMFIVFLAKATDSLRWGRGQYWLLAIMALVMSKAWLWIGPLNYKGLDFTGIMVSNQRLFMNNGPGMTTENYVIQTAYVLLAGIIVYFFCIRKRLGEWVEPG